MNRPTKRTARRSRPSRSFAHEPGGVTIAIDLADLVPVFPSRVVGRHEGDLSGAIIERMTSVDPQNRAGVLAVAGKLDIRERSLGIERCGDFIAKLAQRGLLRPGSPPSEFQSGESRLWVRVFQQKKDAVRWLKNAGQREKTGVGLGLGEREASGSVPRSKAVEEHLRRVLEGAIDQALADKPDTYEARREVLTQVRDAARLAIIRVLEPLLNERAAATPHETYEQKKSLARWVNAELRWFGLAIKSDRTDAPCLLVANTTKAPGDGRFMLDFTDDEGRHHRPVATVALPRLSLTMDDLVRAPRGPSR